MRDDEGCGQYDDPHIYAVKKKRDHDLTAGTKCEIRRVREGAEGHCDGGSGHHISGDLTHLIARIVHHWEETGEGDQKESHRRCAGDGERHHLSVCILGFLRLACTEQIADDDGDGRADCHIDDVENVEYGRADIQTRDNVKTSRGVRLVAERDGKRPEKFVCHQRKSLGDDTEEKDLGNAEGSECADEIAEIDRRMQGIYNRIKDV